MLTAAGSYTKTFQTIHGCDSVIALTLTVDPTYLQKIAAEHKFSNITMFEKTIRAFSLLESLALSGCPFVFKGNKMCSLEIVKQLYDICINTLIPIYSYYNVVYNLYHKFIIY